MPLLSLPFGVTAQGFQLPNEIDVRDVPKPRFEAVSDPLATVASALDTPVGAPPLTETAAAAKSVVIVVPDRSRPAIAHTYLLPVLARLAQAGLDPSRIRVIVARGIHAATPRADVERMLGGEIVRTLRPIQSAPNTPELNEEIGEDSELGPVRIHRVVADADLVILTGVVQPHHLAGFAGGAKALVPGVADRDTVHAAHRLTLDALVRPDGSIRPAVGSEPNRFRTALTRIARLLPRTFLLNVWLDDDGHIAGARAGDIEHAHVDAMQAWERDSGRPEPYPADLVIAGTSGPRADNLIQAHKSLIEAVSWAKPGAPIIWSAPATDGPGHPALLPWFEAGKLPRHLAALREQFHPYGLTAYSIRRIAKDHPVHTVSALSRDILRPMGLLAFSDAQKAVDFALKEAEERQRPIASCAFLR